MAKKEEDSKLSLTSKKGFIEEKNCVSKKRRRRKREEDSDPLLSSKKGFIGQKIVCLRRLEEKKRRGFEAIVVVEKDFVGEKNCVRLF